MAPVWRTSTKYIVAIGLVGLGLWIVYLSLPVIPLLILAGLLALLLSPIERFLQTRLRMPRWLAIAITYILLLAAMAVVPWLILTSLGQTIRTFDASSRLLSLDGLAGIAQRLRATPLPVPGLNILLSNSIERLLATIQATIGGLAGGVTTGTLPEIPASLGQALLQPFVVGISWLGATLSLLTSLTLILTLAVYLNFSYEWLHGSVMEIVPVSYRPEIAGVLDRIRSIWAGYLRGQVLMQLIIGVAVWLGLTLLGLPGALALGFVAAILYLVPNVGLPLAALPAPLLAALFGSSHLAVSPGAFALVVVAFYALLILLIYNVVGPIVMTTSVKLHPLILTVGILVGAAAGGVLGAVLAAPVIATGQVVVAYLYGKILQQPGGEGGSPGDEAGSPADRSDGTRVPVNVHTTNPQEGDNGMA
jgi:predicted PurR-regulated permease PerM